jgi:outer membrane protein OmpA-like peptidoglycan-associated protein
MKRFILCTLLVVAFGVYNHVQAQFENVVHAWGFSAGGAHGANTGRDQWVLQYRGYLQHELIYPMLTGQLGVGYTSLKATGAPPKAYTASTGMADFRLLYAPFSLVNFNPYLYGGFGVTKQLNIGGTDFLMMVPVGVGAQTKITPSTLLTFSAGYNLSLSDKLDGRIRTTNTDVNPLTNGKQDGFYGFSIGLAFTLGGGNAAAEETKKKELADAEARRVKRQADTEARRVKQQADAEAEARRVKQQADAGAEARRVKELADVEAQRVKQQADAEARRTKELADAEALRVKQQADAEARRLAEKSRDTIFVLIKGKTVVLRGVNFEFNKATLTRDSEIILWRAYNAMVANPTVRVVITGHTDNVGGQKFNQDLSLKRAQTVKNWLVKKGIKSNRMRTAGRGQNEPVASNETDAGRAENRRMEFFVQ